ncbi:hypothetical protein [Bacillus massilinigeriensis]|uniref:hypothetical protein n=1 Tax=Bacillus massilionigeriensis TaxID=1805475 RepID=UPI00096B1227|nr:hypothetical protein [Bacillus massilionigeriensis]
MLKNEKGSTLLVVMLMVFIFSVLGLSIISTSIGGAKRTEVRENEVVDNLEAIKKVNEGVAVIRSYVDKNFDPKEDIREYSQKLNSFIECKSSDNEAICSNPTKANIENDEDEKRYEITNISFIDNPDKPGEKLYNISEFEDYSRVLEVSSEYAPGKYYTQLVYITAMPSFLKYSIGSRGGLTINGSAYLQGNIYANKSLSISKEAKYTYASNNYIVKTELPSFFDEGNNNLMVETGKVKYCENSCYDSDNSPIEDNWKDQNVDNIVDLFEPYDPDVSDEKLQFVQVDILNTFFEKLISAGFDISVIPTDYLIEKSDPLAENQRILDFTTFIKGQIKKNADSINGKGFETITSFNQFKDIGKSVLYQGDAYIDLDNLNLSKGNWLIIDGNAFFESSGTNQMSISANILVTGNISFKGKFSIDSTMYVLGNASVNDVDIEKTDSGSELILMAQKELNIARFNKFFDPTDPTKINENRVDKINGYLYTASDATVYAIGSYIYVDGGVFAKGNLEVNSFRGKVNSLPCSNNNDDSNCVRAADVNSSRLIIKNNKRLFLNQVQGLPRVDKLDVMTDLMKKGAKTKVE